MVVIPSYIGLILREKLFCVPVVYLKIRYLTHISI